MLLISHILIALTSVVLTTFLYFSPSKNKITASYGLMASTLLSGTVLVVATHSPLISACVSGLIYTFAVSVGIFAASKKLAHNSID